MSIKERLRGNGLHVHIDLCSASSLIIGGENADRVLRAEDPAMNIHPIAGVRLCVMHRDMD